MMVTEEFRIPVTTALKTGLEISVFKQDTAAEILSEAKEIARVFNSVYKEKAEAQNLAGCAVIYKAIQAAIDFFLKDNPGYFKSVGGKDVLSFFTDEYGEFSEEDRQVRFFFVNRVLDKSRAIKKEMGVLFENPAFKVPQRALSLLELLKTRGGKIKEKSLFDFLTEPFEKYPDSLKQQLLFIAENWSGIIGDEISLSLKRSFSMLSEDFSPALPGGPAPTYVPDYFGDSEYENFSPDLNWMPNVVMIAKNTLVWLSQLSNKYGRNIRYLSDIPNEELDSLKRNGFNALWLIGLWERSAASKDIKNRCGNPEAEASAYSLKSYSISASIGGWLALDNLRQRCTERGIRLASDMVPNHTGLDSDWVKNHPDYFIKQKFLPFDNYTFNGPNLSKDPDLDIRIEDHYYSRSDAAVVFKRTDNRTGETDYVWHGNDGTTMPWNDTAQLDFLNPVAREAVIRQILDVARNFRIIRFDAAMTLARKHIHRLWYPTPGTRPDIAGRGIFGKTDEEFARDLPLEFWREVVDRVAKEVPDTLLLAEAFWMMEGYFVRTLGMHRVYNSAFMNMLKNQENAKYRESIKKTLLFNPEILKRYVNFMNNPDEDPAIVQFGRDDRYFGVCTLLSTMPGLPMFGHGQIEGFSEKYGMEYTRAYKDEHEDPYLVSEHGRRIFPLLRKRYLFSGCELFNLFDFNSGFGTEESVFAYTNGCNDERVLVLYNNRYERCEGTIFSSAAKVCKDRETRTFTIAEALNIQNADSSDFLTARLFNSEVSLVKRIGRIKNEGLTFALDGYRSMVFKDFRILKATDELNALERGLDRFCLVDNLESELAMHKKRPVVECTQRLLERGFKEEVSLLCDCPWRSTAVRSVSKILLPWYAEMQNFAEILNFSIDSKNCVSDIREIALLNKCPFFASAKDVEDSWKETMAAYLLIKPFITSKKPVEILRTATSLPFACLFNPDAVERACILMMQMPKINRLDSEPEELNGILGTPLFRKIIGENEYRGKRYYNSERLFSTVLFILAADAMDSIAADKRLFNKRYEQTLAFWLKRVHDSEYLIDRLLD